jgi:hypothetical protein
LARILSTKFIEVIQGKNFGKAATTGAPLFIKGQTVCDDLQYLILGVYPRQFSGQAGMATEFSTQLDPEAPAGTLKGIGRAHGDTAAAVQAAPGINRGRRPISLQNDSRFTAGLDTGRAICAVPIAGFGDRCSDDADVFDLGL